MTFQVRLDPVLGGRWSSLRDPSGHEWLWRRPHPRRAAVAPGDAFVDVGGVEECFPTLVGGGPAPGGEPLDDHGGAWSRPWTVQDDEHRVTVGALTLHRTVRVGERVEARYTVTGPPGRPFVWAWHALVDPAPSTVLLLDGGPALEWADGTDRAPRVTPWPRVGDEARFDVVGPDDGTARFALLPNRRRVEVVGPGSALVVELTSEDDLPVGVGLWRNLGGWSWDGATPYRSLGVEPMIGRTPTAAGPVDDVAVLPPGGTASWTLTLSAGPRRPSSIPDPLTDEEPFP